MNMTLEKFENEIENNKIKINNINYEIKEQNFKLNVFVNFGEIEFEFEIDEEYEINDDCIKIGSLTIYKEEFENEIEIDLHELQFKECNIYNFFNEVNNEKRIFSSLNEELFKKITDNFISIELDINEF
ncbi:hypothetical protein [Aliarcobacter cryaerophilus]|uniref:hypothetical protein n=1 Tax=Aliarcobacter cryaerophilus TaxID=28198 RepID=UPI0021B56043|nr:hypothetical protein [Aliarcobacter cryaerophilus]MCT7406388.1 hypothetical protein [Aliarcobacter cryaerophilus]